MDTAYALVAHSLNGTLKKTSILIHNKTVISNATTAWAPTRVDMQSTTPQETYAQHWLEQLAIHELRHLIQIDKMNTGITNVLSIILGEQAKVFMAGIFVPNWFLEGDAVFIETALSNSGRGRLPSFEMPLKAQILEKGKYSYEKAVHGSYKDFVPGAYNLGYLLIASGRQKYGSQLWRNTVEMVGNRPYLITSFSRAIKEITGFSKQQFYHSTFTDLQGKWSAQIKNETHSEHQSFSPKSRYFTNYRFPNLIPDEGIIAVKSSIADIQRFVLINKNGTESTIFTPGPNLKDPLTYANNIICWSEIEFDARWENRNYSVIKTYNLNTKKLTQLTKKSRFFAPALSKDGSKIATVEVSSISEHSLVLLDSKSGIEIKRFKLPNNDFIITPSWSAEGNKIVFISMNDEGKAIQILNLVTGDIEKMMSETFIEISHPQLKDQFIYFTGAYSGIDNIYALDRSTKEIFQITRVKYGANDALINEENNTLTFANYTSDGYELVQQILDKSDWVNLENIRFSSINLTDRINKDERSPLKIDKTNLKQFETKKYYKATGLLNFHSWAPVSINANTYDVKPGVSFMSQNTLSTAFATMGYEYNTNESVGRYYFNYSYQGFYPIIDIRFGTGKRREFVRDASDDIHNLLYNESNLETEIRLPIIFSKNKYYKGIWPSISMKSTFLSVDDDSPIQLIQNTVHSLNYRFYAYHRLRSSSRDLYPRWGQIIDLQHGNMPFQNENKSSISAVAAVLYFPGLIKHHGIKIYGGYQKRVDGFYTFPQIINYPRGFYNQLDIELYRSSINYKLPLMYPDINIGSLIYLKRLKLAFYYDYAFGKHPEGNTTYRSAGFELTSDFHFLSLQAPVDLGLRYIYNPDQNTYNFEFLFSVDFHSLY
ncbi:MAG: hypothetical protein GY834_06455 [Bacteroidetes bacterium]|nr:hypothetical protein [Bacteroidota bacterium]